MSPEIPVNVMALRALLSMIFIAMPNALNACPASLRVDLSGLNIADFPRNLNKSATHLSISHTNINMLNLTVAVEYPMLCWLQVTSSPVSFLITPNPPQTVALTTLYLASGTFLTPPDLGIVLSRQLIYLSFVNIGIINVPENYFQNYTSLLSLNLDGNPISKLNPGSLAGLRHLSMLYLTRSSINPIPPLYLWLPNLNELHIAFMGLKVLPGIILENLPQLRTLNVIGNQLSTIPPKEQFVNLQNMHVVRLAGNPLRCDARLCWIKVNVMTCIDKG